ncbi:hypothetical protein C1925_04845 [Stenotrophomonas sp. SAU14A_NAIMI4_5]|uniref:hypothetical protein n=1 Tax=Stenotrophomonas sp. SAU14A_NAIMI4_5 TaxID=2072413 RepID=UPI000D542988|nr:hypothetical protein [Stenotrophomonas sp. SAU14A_NAIMI4_5]AWH48532.1 hypothetical protein C1925_04845 [Stenotrophomonas sp. SAU14A_NAIMI4_5]
MSVVAILVGPQQRGRAVADAVRIAALRIGHRPDFANTVADLARLDFLRGGSAAAAISRMKRSLRRKPQRAWSHA